jgi:capsular polysaccharide transport system permease protein
MADTKKAATANKPKKAAVVRLATSEKAQKAESHKTRPKSRRRNYLALSFLLFVIFPIIAGSYFWIQMASDRYVSGAGFSVRSMEQGGGSDFLGGLTGMASSGSTSSDSYIVMKYLESRAMVEHIEARKPMSEIFSGDHIDPLFRMPVPAGMEDKVAYWQSRIETSYDSASGIIDFSVEAFNREDALLLSQIVLEEAGVLVNKLSENARREAVANANAEVSRAEERLRSAMLDLRRFRDKHGDLDPTATAAAQLEIDTRIESEVTDLRARISVLEPKVSAKAPNLIMLKDRLSSLEAQLAEEKGAADVKKRDLAARLEDYETINIEKQFAQQAYTTALSSLEQARVQADGQQRYLAVFSEPATPEVAMQPRRALNILLLAICALSFWGIGTLVTYAVRDHTS